MEKEPVMALDSTYLRHMQLRDKTGGQHHEVDSYKGHNT